MWKMSEKRGSPGSVLGSILGLIFEQNMNQKQDWKIHIFLIAFWWHFVWFGAPFWTQFWHFSSFGDRKVAIGWKCENEHGVETRRSFTCIDEVKNRTKNDQKLVFGHVVVETHLWITIWGHLGAFWSPKVTHFCQKTTSENDPKFETKKRRKKDENGCPNLNNRSGPGGMRRASGLYLNIFRSLTDSILTRQVRMSHTSPPKGGPDW